VKSPENLAVFHRSLVRWYRRHGRDLPWRRTRDPYAILVSEFMLQQTQVATVIPYYHDWLRRFPDFRSLARASENEVLRAWQGLGYYARARNLHATAKTVMDLAEISHEKSSKCDNFPASGNILLTPSPALHLINRFRSSKRILLAFWRGF
jgi:adenine-specific DNA glycosylase